MIKRIEVTESIKDYKDLVVWQKGNKEFEIDNQIIEIKKMICGLVKSLSAD
jgi:hypothetical protein